MKDNSDLLDIHLSGDEDNEMDDFHHKNLEKVVGEIVGKKKPAGLRKELSSNIASIRSLDKVVLTDLIGNEIKNNKELGSIKQTLDKKNVLEIPMHRGEHEKIQRVIGYDEAVKVVSKWEHVVKENRQAKQMKFPIVSSEVAVLSRPIQFHRDKRPTTKLEKEVAQLLKGNNETVAEKKPLSLFDERVLQAMSTEEAKQRRADLQKQRALLSQYAAKMKRQGKIKSKRYHRVLKKARQKEEQKKLENLKEKDPKAYQEWLLKEEKRRIEERMTLKHKGGSKKMKRQITYGKYNMESRQAVHDMLEKGKELTVKHAESDGEDEEEVDDDEDDVVDDITNRGDVEVIEDENEDDDEDEDSGAMEEDEDDGVVGDDDAAEEEENDDENGEIISQKLNRKKTLEDMNKKDEDDVEEIKTEKRKRKSNDDDEVDLPLNKKAKISENEKPMKIKPNQFNELQQMMDQAGIENKLEFTDVVTEFIETKKAIEERDKLKDIDMTLPGWGDWTGKGIKVSKRKRKRFTIKAPKAPPRKDQNRPVIISETKDEAIAKHQVKALPWNVNNVHSFQKVMEQPIGKQWNREDVYRKLIKPKTVVKLGTIIEPIDKSVIPKDFKEINEKHKLDDKSNRKFKSNKKGKSKLTNKK